MLHNQLNDIQNTCDETAEIIQDLQKRIPKLPEPDAPPLRLACSLTYSHLSKSIYRNTLVLERKLYSNNPSEYNLNIDDRKISMDKVTFIQECVLRHFGIPEASRGEV
uniref:Ras-associating domain-containing protein n=1 Tax=Heterorhabditis bacteriophora TaxID=37862 RepID=A0A1I7W7P2_HETBA